MHKYKFFFFLCLYGIFTHAQTGPGGVGDDTTNVLWLRAEDITGLSNQDDIQLWPDHSSHNNDLTQSDNNYNPVYRENYVNSYPVAQFKKNKNRIRKTNFNNFPTDKITAIYVTKTKDKNDGILSYASTADDDDFLIFGSNDIRPHINHNFNSTQISVNNNLWHISQTSWEKYNGDLESWKDGSRDYTGTLSYPNGITAGGCLAIGGDQDGIDSGYSSKQTHAGYMPEVIIYNVYLNQAQHIIVGNYLSAKYDITLSANDFYTQDDNDFDFNVAGIGQATDGSNHTDSQGSGIIRINNPSDLNNDEYLFWGENIKDATYDFTQVDNETYRINTLWRISKRNNLGTVSLSFNETDINLNTGLFKCAGLFLIISPQQDFSTKTSYELQLNNGVYTVNSINFADADYFSLEYRVKKTEWDGNNWTNNTPDLSTQVSIAGDYDMNNLASISACSCQINTGKSLHITDGKYLEVQNDIINDGTILIENEGALVQIADDSNISGNGIFQLNKTSMPLDHYYDYVYWSTPIKQGNLSLGDVHANSWRYYKFDPTIIYNPGQIYPGWVMLSASDLMETGIGYAISAPANHTAGHSISAVFVKNNDPFNNGDISVNIYKRGGTNGYGDNNLLGNPYPSAIDFNQFANDNPSVEGSYALWTKCAGLDSQQHHQEDGYTIYTVSGGSGTATTACNGSGETAGRYIATTQGFMINGITDNSTATFKNNQRVTGHNDNFLNRPASIDRDILWLNLTDESGKFSQMALGFYPDATDDYDRMYDARNANEGNGFSLSSLLNGRTYAIQGLKKEDIINQTIHLSVESDIDRNIRFHLDSLEGFEHIHIYLHDTERNETIDLKYNDYSCAVEPGNNNNRFELIFNTILRDEEISPAKKPIIITQKDGIFTLNAIDNHIRSVYVYDSLGRLIYKNKQVNHPYLQINLHQVCKGNLLIFKVIEKGDILSTQKIPAKQ